MNRIPMCVLVVLGCGIVSAADTPPRVVDVAALVRQLGSGEFAQREEAEKQLSALSVGEVPPELLAALKSPDAEVRDRAARAVKSLRERIALGKLPRGERFAKRGQIDLYVASTALGDYKAEDPRLWEPALDVGREAIKSANLKGNRMPHGCPALYQDIAEYKKAHRVWFTRTGEAYTKYRADEPEAILAPSVAGEEGFGFHIVVSRGSVSTKRSISESFMLATGDIDVGDNISKSVIICDGDVRVGARVYNSLIVARGSISIKGWRDSCGDASTLIAGGTIQAKVPEPPVLLPGDNPDDKLKNKFAIEDFERIRFEVREKQISTLGFISFFELRRVGLEVKVADGAVAIAKVTAGGACEKAGLRVGDTILEVYGKKPADAESLRRLLRDALAIGDAPVKVQRGKDMLTIKLALPE